MNRILQRAAGSLLIFVAGVAGAQGLAQGKPQFFATPPAQLKSANAKSVQSQAAPVRFNAKEMLGMRHLDEIQVTLPNGMAHDAIVDLVQSHGDGIASWVGRLKDYGNQHRVVITTGPAGSFGVIDTPHGSYRIVPGEGNDWLIDMALEESLQPQAFETREDDSRRVPPGELSPPPDLSNARYVPALAGVNTSALTPKHTPALAEVDLMFVVTQGFQSHYGAAAMATRLNFLVTRANTAYADSHVGVTLRLVNTTVVNHPDSGDLGDILDSATPNCSFCAARTPYNSAAFGAIETIRSQVGADLVAIMLAGSTTGGAGIAWAPPTPGDSRFAYSVTRGCMTSCESVFVHELGHNMGNSHDRATTQWQSWSQGSGGAYTSDFTGSGIAFGYAYCASGALTCDPTRAPNAGGCSVQPECSSGSATNNFSDLMSYFHGTTRRVFKFSNADPAITCAANDGTTRACGIASGTQAADTATSMNNNRAALSAIRATVTNNLTLTVAKTGTGAGTVTSAPMGINCGATCAFSFAAGTQVTLTAAPAAGSAFTGWTGGGCGATGTCQVTLAAAASVTASFTLAGASPLGIPSPTSVDFGGQSIQTTSGTTPVTLTNIGAGTLNILSVAASPAVFAQTNNCAALALSATCTINVTLTPTATGAIAGNLTIQTTVGTLTVPLAGSGERSLVTHYYRAILNRAPDAAGKAFWEGEFARLGALGSNPNESWFLMANYFFNSPEYIAANKTDTAFMIDVYNTFFNRPPDQGGFDYWMSQMNTGLSREGVIFWFMFSNEFRSFTQGIFGSTAARPEVDLVMDLFRGILNRFPDTAAFNAFVGGLRSAQCQPPAARTGAVYTNVNDASYFFLFGSAEYANRVRTNTQFVSDMYNAFLRRGGTASEVAFWINQLNTGAKDRNRVRADFIASPEFGARVNAVINAGCVQ